MAKKVHTEVRRKTNNDKPGRYTRKEMEQYEKELRKHFGRWVCVMGYRIVSVADGPAEALEMARKSGYKNVRVKRAPLSPNARLLIA